MGCCLLSAGPASAAPTFDDHTIVSHSGAALLQWSGDGTRFELQHAQQPDFGDARVLYVGAMPSAHVSGLRDGVHRFRVRADGEDAWSEPAKLTVEHHPMSLVWALFAIGGLVFAATAAFVATQAAVRGRST